MVARTWAKKSPKRTTFAAWRHLFIFDPPIRYSWVHGVRPATHTANQPSLHLTGQPFKKILLLPCPDSGSTKQRNTYIVPDRKPRNSILQFCSEIFHGLKLLSFKHTTRTYYESRLDLNLFLCLMVEVFVHTAVGLPVPLKIASPPPFRRRKGSPSWTCPWYQLSRLERNFLDRINPGWFHEPYFAI